MDHVHEIRLANAAHEQRKARRLAASGDQTEARIDLGFGGDFATAWVRLVDEVGRRCGDVRNG
jgi:hypothetical protein